MAKIYFDKKNYINMVLGVLGLQSPDHSLESLPLAMAILGISFLSESVTLGLAIKSIRRSARSVSEETS